MRTFVFGLSAPAHTTLLAHGRKDVLYERTSGAPSLSNKSKPKLAHRGEATWDAELQTSPGPFAWFGGLGCDVRSLCEQGQLDRALDALVLMDQQGTAPSVNMYRSLLKACARKKAMVQAKHVYAHLSRHGLEITNVLGEDLVSTLMKCGAIGDALELFQRLPRRSVFAWTALISGYANSGQGLEALRAYQRMREEGLQPNTYTFVGLLRACGSLADLGEGKAIHDEASKCNCDSDLFVRTALVDMYGKCGSIVDAECVYESTSQGDVVACNVMMAAYVDQRQPEKALELFDRIREHGLQPNNVTFLTALQACGMLAEKEEDAQLDGRSPKAKYLERGKALHLDISRSGYGSDTCVGSTLVSMYGKCGSIVDAQRVFDGLQSKRNMVVCTAMLAAFVHVGYEVKALQWFEQMQAEGLSPDARTYVSVLQACGILAQKGKDGADFGGSVQVEFLKRGRAIHADARRKGYDSDLFVGNTLIRMYSRCGSIKDAQSVFDALSQRDIVSWNSLLSAYIEHGLGSVALQLYEHMQEDGWSPNVVTFVCGLQACGIMAEEEEEGVVEGGCTKVVALGKGKEIHADARRVGCDSDVLIGNALINFYAKCWSMVDAQIVFDGLARRTVVTWTSILGVYIRQGLAEKALHMYDSMEKEGVSPNDHTIAGMLQACSTLAVKEEGIFLKGELIKAMSVAKGKTVHAYAQRRKFDTDIFVSNALVSMYGKCGSIVDVQCVFDGMAERNVVTWSGMLMAHVGQGQAEKAWQLYKHMQQECVSPDVWASVSALHACMMLAESEANVLVLGRSIKVESVEKGKAIHADVTRRGYNTEIHLANALISMYGKCGSIVDAESVFYGLFQWNVVSWNALLAVFVQQGEAQKALQLCNYMLEEGVSPDNRTFVAMLQACGMVANCKQDVTVNGLATGAKCLEKVEAVHTAAQLRGYGQDAYVASTLVSVYGKCGSIVDARAVFDGLLHRNVVSWNAMLAAYVEQGQGEKALQLYRQGQQEWVRADEITLVSTLKACSQTGCLNLVRQIHQTHVSNGNQWSPLLVNTLISAYGRCASMADARNVFNALLQPDVASWTALISGYARRGTYMMGLDCYRDMQLAGVKPDAVTFVALLSACSHAGLVDKGAEYFESMTRDHGIAPGIEHFGSMVDLFGRAGCFTRLKCLLASMPIEPDLAIWLDVLGSCQKHGNVELSEVAFRQAVHIDPCQSAPYVLMCNILQDAGHLDLAKEVMAIRSKVGARYKPGQMWTGETRTLPEQLDSLLVKLSSTLKVIKPFSGKAVSAKAVQVL